jgi:hypothetical protein
MATVLRSEIVKEIEHLVNLHQVYIFFVPGLTFVCQLVCITLTCEFETRLS